MIAARLARRGCAAAVLALAVLASGAVPAQPRTHTVTIEAMGYTPQALTVKRGDRVVWMNKDPFPHTATATSNTFDSGSIAAGASWSYVANGTGRFDYVCTFHPTMKGTLVVE